MKTTILSIAAAAAITLGTAGAASAAAPAAKAGGLFGGTGAKLETVHYRGRRWRHRSWRHRRMCRRLRYRGFVLGHWRARRAYYRLCRYRHWH
jgi:hypothetical protein